MTKKRSNKQPLLVHLQELKVRVLYSLFFFISFSIIAYYLSSDIFKILVSPLLKVSHEGQKFIFTKMTEVFLSYLGLSCICGFIFSFPLIMHQIYIFIKPGLLDTEKKAVLPILIISPLLFVLGSIFAYYIIMPVAWQFFVSFEIQDSVMPVVLEAKVSEYISLVMSFIFSFGLAFQIPVVIVLLHNLELIKIESLQNHRRGAIIVIFIAAAILTPPDVISQILLALPMMLLYELSIIICKYYTKTKEGVNNA